MLYIDKFETNNSNKKQHCQQQSCRAFALGLLHKESSKLSVGNAVS